MVNGVAIMACDPGGISGCAQAIFNLKAKSVKLAMRRAVFKGTLNAWEEHGSSEEQSLSIVEKWLDFVRVSVRVGHG